MSNLGFKGIDVRETAGSGLLFRASLKDSTGAIVPSGTTSLRFFELQLDGSLKTYDFNNNTFTTGAVTIPTASMTEQKGANSSYDTGLWTYALNNVSGLTPNAIYMAQVSNTGASPPQQEREFQWGGHEGDQVIGAIPRYVAGSLSGLPIGDSNGRVKIVPQTPFKNQAINNFPFVMTNASTNLPMSGLTVTAQRRLDSASSFSSCTNSPTEVSNGAYSINLSAADMNADTCLFRFSASGAADSFIQILTHS